MLYIPDDPLYESLIKLGLSRNQSKVLTLLIVENKPMTVREIRKMWNTPRTAVYHVLTKLIEYGLVDKKSPVWASKNIPNKYFITGDPELAFGSYVNQRRIEEEKQLNAVIDEIRKVGRNAV